jgi:hypothetical protein
VGYDYVITGKVVTDEVLFTPTGSFGRWAKSIEFGLLADGVREAPLNRRQNKSFGQPPVGSLKASIRAELTHATVRTYNIELSANTHYAAWVHEGTSTIIKRGAGGRFASADSHEGMYLPSNLGFKARWRQRVRGQAANPFLRRAWNDVALHHSAMGRFSTY